ncbi:glycoside hydrolase family 95 protein [Rhizomicrobium electricum]|uniref:Glycoside hydrolase N-terminal domain-containing protein n=1 Tax=Rhizomicrobium electricum TaxID=480070 RepID=A0ABP3PP23_9PROT|nr:glycoside hydrolase family 95 protein [Rhizomicrobium electricum]NIJ48911.1 alpha-L-fucosidase 2 [Rhizomicrobium electricum]
MRLRTVAVLILAAIATSATAGAGEALSLWYDKPAADWEHYGLPIGNGAMGAVISGGVVSDDIQFNEKTLWTGGPGAPGYDFGLPPQSLKPKLAEVQARLAKDLQAKPEDIAAQLGHQTVAYGDYQTFGDLVLTFDRSGTPDTYRRALDIGQAVARTSYQVNGVRYSRAYFASYPAHVIVIRLTASQPGKIGFTAKLTAPANRSAIRTASAGRISERGALNDNGLKYEAGVQVIATGGSRIDNADGSVTVKGADSAVVILAAGTNYLNHYPDYRGPDPHEGIAARLDAAAKKPYAALLKEHVADHSRLMGRVALDLGGKMPNLPTDALVKGYGKDAAADRALETLFFQYGRYLLIASSRAGSLPANLQGVWNASTTPPWNDDYHVNINLQMNYWLADVTGLPETLEPFHAFVDGLVEPGRASAERIMGTKGWTLFLNTNIWGYTGVIAWPTAFWQPEAGAWLASQYYDHYRFTRDRAFLERRAYPVMKGAADVWLEALVTDPRDGKLVVSPSYSPEHGPFSAGAAMSQQIVYGLFSETAEAARILGDGATAEKLDAALKKLDPGLAVGKWGQLREWKEEWDDPKDEHRHTSHLYALHPGMQISPLTTPVLAEAAKVSLRARGDSTTSHGEAGTGWSKAWKMNFWARLYDGDHAHLLLSQLLKENAMANLWDQYVGPPFQIDGNFGATAGIAEMLLQSHGGIIDILPALPKAWSNGAVRGLRARGGLIVDMTWRNGRVRNFTLIAQRDGAVKVRSGAFAGHFKAVDTKGRALNLVGEGEVRTLSLKAGERYLVTAF